MKIFLLSAFLSLLAAIPAAGLLRRALLQQPEQGNWWSRMTDAYPYRAALARLRIALPVWAIILTLIIPLFAVPIRFDLSQAWCAFLGAWCGSVVPYVWCEFQLIRPPHPARAAIVQLVLSPPSIFLYVVAVIVWAPVDRNIFSLGIPVGAFLLLFLLWILGGWFWIFRKLGWIRRANRRFEALAAPLLTRLNLEKTPIFEMPFMQVNAFAHTILKQMIFTEAAIERMDDSELRSIVAHEAGHLLEGWNTSLKRISSYFLLLPVLALRLILHAFGFPFLMGTLFVVYAIVILLGFVTRKEATKLEQAADSVAHRESDEGVYATSLEKLSRLNFVPPIIGRKRMRHPEVYDRMVAAGVTPTYARPDPPSQGRASAMILIALVIFSTGFILLTIG